MRVVIVGLGVQGDKRRAVIGDDCVGTVDPLNPVADYRDIIDVPLDSFDAALCCIPDRPKYQATRYLLENGKHVLIEKPLWLENDSCFAELELKARVNNTVCYTAYNHRFEPNFIRVHQLLNEGAIGRVYRCRLFYGNGTARLVRESTWRDDGSGVVHDLGSHLLDTIQFWFGRTLDDFSVYSSNRFENKSPDYVVFGAESVLPKIECELSLLSWRNSFRADIVGEEGSIHVDSLCKWSESTLTVRRRILPSGVPRETVEVVAKGDPTWKLEYEHFKVLCARRSPTDLTNDRKLQQSLNRLGSEAIRMSI